MKTTLGNLVIEALLVGSVGIGFGLLGNWLSPRGVALTHNYFPEIRTDTPALPAGSAKASSPQAVPTGGAPPNRIPATPEKEDQLPMIGLDQMVRLLHSKAYQEGLVVFIDARPSDEFNKGHIPGAYLFDSFHPDRYIAEVLPACQAAQKVVVYCHGGRCEDSKYAAATLIQLGIAQKKLSIFQGGMTEWEDRGQPLQKGEGRRPGGNPSP